jgi:WD40 repeat protein
MSTLITCPCGHVWSSPALSPAEAAGPLTCPACGARIHTGDATAPGPPSQPGAGQPIKARGVGALVVLSAASLLLAAALLVSNFLLREDRRRTEDALARETDAGEHLAQENVDLAEANARVSKEKARAEDALARERQGSYFQKITLAHRDYLANDLISAALVLQDCPAAPRRWEWRYLFRACAAGQTPLVGGPWVSAMAPRPDGKRLVFVSWHVDGRQGVKRRLHWLDLDTARELKAIDTTIDQLAFSPDGKRLVASAGLELRLLDAETAAEKLTLGKHARGIDCIAFSPDGKRIASAGGTSGEEGELKLWDAGTGKLLHSLRPATRVLGLAFAPEGNTLATAEESGTVNLRAGPDGKRLKRLTGHDGPARAVSFSPDGAFLASGGDDWSVRLWQTKAGQEFGTRYATLRGHTGPVAAVAFSPDGKVASAGEDRTIRFWDLDEPQAHPRGLILRGHTRPVVQLAFSRDGLSLVSAADGLAAVGPFTGFIDSELTLWDMSEHVRNRDLWAPSPVSSVAVSPDEKWVLAAAGPSVYLRQRADGALAQLAAIPKHHKGRITNVAFSPDGKRFATGSEDGTALLWEAAAKKPVGALKGHSGGVLAVAFRPGGRQLASASRDRTAKVWDVATGKEVFTFKGHKAAVGCVCYSADGRRAASATGLKSGDREGEIEAAAKDSTIKVWDADSGAEQRTIRGQEDGVFALAFSPDGKLLASAGPDPSIHLWDLATGKEVRALKGHIGAVSSLAFSPDGDRLASAGSDGTVRLWDVPGGRLALTLRGHSGEARGVAFDRTGHLLVSGGGTEEQGEVKLWDATPVEEE